MPERLTNVKIKEISFVDRGASGDEANRPRVALWKRRKVQPQKGRSSEMPDPKFSTEDLAKRAASVVSLAKEGLPDSAQAVFDTIKEQLSEEQFAFLEMMLQQAGAMTPKKPEPSPEEKAGDQREELEAGFGKFFKLFAFGKASDMEPSEPGKTKPATRGKAKPQKPQKPKVKQPGDQTTEKLAKVREAQPELADLFVDMQKRMEATEERLEQSEAEKQELAKRLEKAEGETAEEIQKRRRADFQKLAETELSHLQGKPEELAKQLCDLQDTLSKPEFEKHLTMLKAANAQLQKSGAFAPEGAPGASSGSAYEEIVAKAQELRKEQKKLTEKQAIAKVMKDPEHRDLVKRHRQEQRGAA